MYIVLICYVISLSFTLQVMVEECITWVTYSMIPFSDSQLREWLTGTKVTNCLRNPLSQRVPKRIAFHDTFPPHNLYLMIRYGLTSRERTTNGIPTNGIPNVFQRTLTDHPPMYPS